MDLADQPCLPSRGGDPPLAGEELNRLAAQLPTWRVVEGHHLEREVPCADFRAALALVVAIGEQAEAQDHHPEIQLAWGRVGLTLYTHAINGLHLADFVLAARIERLIPPPPD